MLVFGSLALRRWPRWGAGRVGSGRLGARCLLDRPEAATLVWAVAVRQGSRLPQRHDLGLAADHDPGDFDRPQLQSPAHLGKVGMDVVCKSARPGRLRRPDRAWSLTQTRSV
jgi:hypothetical protein